MRESHEEGRGAPSLRRYRRRTQGRASAPGLGVLFVAAWLGGCGSSRDGFKIGSASSLDGIRGSLVQNGVTINFESKVSGDSLTARISSAGGRVLWSYREEGMRSSSLDGPTIFIDGAQQFTMGRSEQVDQLRGVLDGRGAEAAQAFFHEKQRQLDERIAAVASSPEGALIKKLALELVSRCGSSDLVAERRGLETAFQALQHAYPSGYPAEATMETADYYYSPEAGYIVLTQHPQANFRHNLARRSAGPHSGPDDGVVPYDDGGQVGDCFGHCGAGCTNDFGGCTYGDWSHVGVSDWSYVGAAPPQCSRCTIDGIFCTFSDWYERSAWHTFTGAVAEGCIAHDGCCRTSFLGCWDPVCDLLLPFALVTSCCCSWTESWTYLGPQRELRFNHYEHDDCEWDH